MAQAETDDCCTGDYGCNVSLHVHGCYSDHGNCDAPEEHQLVGGPEGHPSWCKCQRMCGGDQ